MFIPVTYPQLNQVIITEINKNTLSN